MNCSKGEEVSVMLSGIEPVDAMLTPGSRVRATITGGVGDCRGYYVCLEGEAPSDSFYVSKWQIEKSTTYVPIKKRMKKRRHAKPHKRY